jgi:hypothetical protein
MEKIDANKVLGTFRKNYEDRKKSMMKSYMEGGLAETATEGCAAGEDCTPGRRRKRKRRNKRRIRRSRARY